MLTRWSYKATPKLRYWLSICHVASNKYPTRKSYKTTPFSHLSHAHMYLHVPYIEQIYQSLSFHYTVYISEICRFWNDHKHKTKLRSYKHTTNALWLPWCFYTEKMKLQSYTKTKISIIHRSCCIESKHDYQTMKSYKTTPISHLSSCPHVYTCSLHCADIPSIIIPSKKYVS